MTWIRLLQKAWLQGREGLLLHVLVLLYPLACKIHEYDLHRYLLDRPATRDPLSQLERRSLCHDPPTRDEGNAVAEKLGFFHVMRR